MEAAGSAASVMAAAGGSAKNALPDLPVDGNGQEMVNVVTWLLVVCLVACLFKFRWLFAIHRPVEGKRLWGVVRIPEGEVWQCRRKNGTVKQTLQGPQFIIACRLNLSQAEESSGQEHCCPAAAEFGRGCENGSGDKEGCSLEAQAPGQLSLSADSTTTMSQSVQTPCTERFAIVTNPAVGNPCE
mmetsp:Transcript_112371/g.223287  ORF Transcript_112371/g.223287 Transcript_112371/m.223287 type:complete len:185 (+) Transcript_112371:193-747(+)